MREILRHHESKLLNIHEWVLQATALVLESIHRNLGSETRPCTAIRSRHLSGCRRAIRANLSFRYFLVDQLSSSSTCSSYPPCRCCLPNRSSVQWSHRLLGFSLQQSSPISGLHARRIQKQHCKERRGRERERIREEHFLYICHETRWWCMVRCWGWSGVTMINMETIHISEESWCVFSKSWNKMEVYTNRLD